LALRRFLLAVPALFPIIHHNKQTKAINNMTGYSDSIKPPKPPIESVAGYAKDKAPSAAAFSKGATNINEIREATEMRRRHSVEISGRPIGPRESGNANSK
jgi:hypothetical protein